VGTVLADEPQMTVRNFDIGRQPLRVVVDRHWRTPLTSRILQGGNTLIAGLENECADGLRASGAETLALPGEQGRVSLPALMAALAAREINEVLVEAGAVLNGALLQAGLVDELLLYYAPTLLGDGARGMFGLGPLTEMAQRIDLDILTLDAVGQDIRVRARPRR
jgi:diaminohydroxyphosphoribosylaminopyrimidine deaminase/5-amino-6-(5-phosphoribosylamino)uracil reductase